MTSLTFSPVIPAKAGIHFAAFWRAVGANSKERGPAAGSV